MKNEIVFSTGLFELFFSLSVCVVQFFLTSCIILVSLVKLFFVKYVYSSYRFDLFPGSKGSFFQSQKMKLHSFVSFNKQKVLKRQLVPGVIKVGIV